MKKASRSVIDEPGVEEGGEDIFTPMPKICTLGLSQGPFGQRRYEICNGVVKRNFRGFHVCQRCGASYGPG